MKTSIKHEQTRGVIYIRVSSDDQVEGTSLDDQHRQCEAIFRAQNLTLVRVFRDEGSTAKNADRAVLMEAIDFARIKRNRIGVFMVWKVDRFARNTEDHFAIRRVLRTAGVELRSATEPIGDEPNAKLFETIVAGFAEFDNSIRRLRCVNGMRARIRSGIWPFKPPVGYQTRSLKRQDKKKTDPDPIDPIVFPILQQVLKGYARRTYSQSGMVEALAKGNFKALTGIEPNLNLIDRLLTRNLRFYAGWLADRFDGEVIYHRGLHEPMITDDEMRVIEMLRDGGPRAGGTHDFGTTRFPLKGLVRCAACGGAFTASLVRGRSRHYPYYHCYARNCALRGSNIPKDLLEQRFSALLERVCPGDGVLAALREQIALSAEERAKNREVARIAGRKTLTALEARRAKVLELAETGAYDAQLARERIDAVEQEIATLRFESEPSEPAQQDALAKTDAASRVIAVITRQWLTTRDDIRQRFQHLVFPQGVPYSVTRGFWNPKTSRLFALKSPPTGSGSTEVHRGGIDWNHLLEELAKFAELAPLLDGEDQAALSEARLVPPSL